jgi:hypothetical protein
MHVENNGKLSFPDLKTVQIYFFFLLDCLAKLLSVALTLKRNILGVTICITYISQGLRLESLVTIL